MAEAKAGHWAGAVPPPPAPPVPPGGVLVGAVHTGPGRGRGNGKGRENTKGKGKDTTNDGWIPCSFHLSGYCRFGKNCKFQHFVESPSASTSTTPQPKALPRDTCRICFQPGHWGNECPLRHTKGTGKPGVGLGKIQQLQQTHKAGLAPAAGLVPASQAAAHHLETLTVGSGAGSEPASLRHNRTRLGPPRAAAWSRPRPLNHDRALRWTLCPRWRSSAWAYRRRTTKPRRSF